MFVLYRILIAALFYCSLPLMLLLVMLTGKHREGLSQRFGFYAEKYQDKGRLRLWLHAASVGEVQAAKAIINEIEKRFGNVDIVVTTMTLTGKRVAEQQLDSSITCYLAPLDIPGIVSLATKKLRPDIYICVETELWPILIDNLARKNVYLGMVNGRISNRSYARYKKIRAITKHILRAFHRLAVISEEDKARYISLGANPGRIIVEGNVKYDLQSSKNTDGIKNRYRELLNITTEIVFIAGSTHHDEELQLLKLHHHLAAKMPLLFVLVPRHIDRVASLEKALQSRGIGYVLLSDVQEGRDLRKDDLLLVDTMGNLAEMYSIGDYIFCGGSLVDKGGHNLMEAAIWHKAVFYGPHIDDFHDAARLLHSVEGGFQVADVEELQQRIDFFISNPTNYSDACLRAGKIAELQQDCSARQVAFLFQEYSANTKRHHVSH